MWHVMRKFVWGVIKRYPLDKKRKTTEWLLSVNYYSKHLVNVNELLQPGLILSQIYNRLGTVTEMYPLVSGFIQIFICNLWNTLGAVLHREPSLKVYTALNWNFLVNAVNVLDCQSNISVNLVDHWPRWNPIQVHKS